MVWGRKFSLHKLNTIKVTMLIGFHFYEAGNVPSSSWSENKDVQRANEGRRLTAEPEDVTVHLISVALKQLSRHFHHLLQVLHLNRGNPTSNSNSNVCNTIFRKWVCVCTWLFKMHLSAYHCRRPGFALKPGVWKRKTRNGLIGKQS